MKTSSIPNYPSGQGGKRSVAAEITKLGSKQTYYTFRLLADRELRSEAFQAYAYFRWLDDLLDCTTGTRQDKAALLRRQQALLDTGYRGEAPGEVNTNEQMLVDLISNDHEEHSGLQLYLRNMMQVMAFDVERCGRLISHRELTEYTRLLSTAVTELMYHLFGHGDPPPCAEGRYHAVYAAHIVHMLRDALEDIPTGYINIPKEVVEAGQISIDQSQSLQFRQWVYGRVKLAREYFRVGRKYIAQVKNVRCRLAGYAYIARFEWMLRVIEREQYCLRPEYPERKSFKAMLWVVWRVISSSLKLRWISLEPGKQPPLTQVCEDG
jgi:phytoene/squalene synthetase